MCFKHDHSSGVHKNVEGKEQTLQVHKWVTSQVKGQRINENRDDDE